MAELANRLEIENAFARRLSKVSSKHRRELIALLGNPPDPGNVPESFWEKVEKEEKDVLTALMLLIFVNAGDQHGDMLLPADLRGHGAEIIRTEAEPWARARAGKLATQYVVKSRERIAKFGTHAPDFFAQTIRQYRPGMPSLPGQEVIGEIKPLPASFLHDELLKVFGPLRDANIAATETTAAATAGTRGAMNFADSLGITTSAIWRTEADGKVCPYCAPLDGLNMSDWHSSLAAISNIPTAILDEVMSNGGPPAHVNCRCWIETIRSKP